MPTQNFRRFISFPLIHLIPYRSNILVARVCSRKNLENYIYAYISNFARKFINGWKLNCEFRPWFVRNHAKLKWLHLLELSEKKRLFYRFLFVCLEHFLRHIVQHLGLPSSPLTQRQHYAKAAGSKLSDNAPCFCHFTANVAYVQRTWQLTAVNVCVCTICEL